MADATVCHSRDAVSETPICRREGSKTGMRLWSVPGPAGDVPAGSTRRRVSLKTYVVGLAVLFVVVVAAGIVYEHTWAGLMNCYVLAWPFYRGIPIGDLTFTAAAFGAHALLNHACVYKVLLNRSEIFYDISLRSYLHQVIFVIYNRGKHRR